MAGREVRYTPLSPSPVCVDPVQPLTLLFASLCALPETRWFSPGLQRSRVLLRPGPSGFVTPSRGRCCVPDPLPLLPHRIWIFSLRRSSRASQGPSRFRKADGGRCPRGKTERLLRFLVEALCWLGVLEGVGWGRVVRVELGYARDSMARSGLSTDSRVHLAQRAYGWHSF